MPFERGERVVLLRPFRLAPESVFRLEVGDSGEVIEDGGDVCRVRIGGLPVTVPAASLQHLRRFASAPMIATEESESYDDLDTDLDLDFLDDPKLADPAQGDRTPRN